MATSNAECGGKSESMREAYHLGDRATLTAMGAVGEDGRRAYALRHRHVSGLMCCSGALCLSHATRDATRGSHAVDSWDPLHLAAAFLCPACGECYVIQHGKLWGAPALAA